MLASAVHAETLSKPLSLAVSATAEARFVWQAVDGAAVYRVAVFDAADAEGKRPLLAAIWVKGLHYDYAKSATIAKIGKLPSTKPLPLPHGRQLRVMVAAARADGSDKSEWAGEDFRLEAEARSAAAPTAVPTAAPTATAVAVSGSAAADDDAEIELEGGEEFKSSPEPAVLDVEDATGAAKGADVTVAAAGAGAPAKDATDSGKDTSPSAASDAPKPELSLADAKALLKAGKAEEAEGAFRELLHKDGSNADLWEGLGDALVARRMKAEALEAYNQALLLDDSRKHLREWIRTNVPRR
jgi:tetratricopeptide (TPR) repeat protein